MDKSFLTANDTCTGSNSDTPSYGLTCYHAKYFANELVLSHPSVSADRISTSLFDACVDLNPHQIEAAHFALSTPLSKGTILADEVGLGKTIEAGLILCQYWAERKRKILVVCPASLRKQWSMELEEKFFLPTIILDTKHFNSIKKNGTPQPFESSAVVIVSYHFAARMAQDIKKVQWNLVVMDEAHKLRNAYKPGNKLGSAIKWALENRKKLLLTATPFQNSLMELYGLSVLLDENIFGETESFRTQYMRAGSDIIDLKRRLKLFCKRTLRKQVLEYVQYTERRPVTRPFTPSDDEQKLYTAVSEFLKRVDTYAIPYRQRHLTVLILRKLLASSSKAISGTLDTIVKRLKDMRQGVVKELDLVDKIIYDEDIEDELLDEFDSQDNNENTTEEKIVPVDLKKLDEEIAELMQYSAWAHSIGVDTKTRTLLSALTIGFHEMQKMGASRRALIFTESRRTQEYLRTFLEANGYAGKITLFNGTNSTPESKLIYERWVEKNKNNGRSTGSRLVDTRLALVENFRDHGEIMIATEAGAEGINLQFCSLVINYDLPWNPQRIEQRIGRCHRYGQKHDVVVINFLNEKNAADKRVLELLQDKFNLFSGVFGASDEIIGSLESGMDFEKRILAIYQSCRTPAEIEQAFEILQNELDKQIKKRIGQTKELLFDAFDEEVHDRLRFRLDDTRSRLSGIFKRFWELTRFILKGKADFDENSHTFRLYDIPGFHIKPGLYRFISKDEGAVRSEFLYRLGHPLGEHVIEQGKKVQTPVVNVVFNITNHPHKITVIENLKGQSGWLTLRKLAINSFENEEYLLFSAIDNRGKSVDPEILEKLFSCSAYVDKQISLSDEVNARLESEAKQHLSSAIAHSAEINNNYFRDEQERLDDWAQGMIDASEKELADTKAQLNQLRRLARQAATTEDYHSIQVKIGNLEKLQRRQRQKIFDVEDEIIKKRDSFVNLLEKRMKAQTKTETLFTIGWEVI